MPLPPGPPLPAHRDNRAVLLTKRRATMLCFILVLAGAPLRIGVVTSTAWDTIDPEISRM
jgi:hypothetical protein